MQLVVHQFTEDQNEEVKAPKDILYPLRYGQSVALVVNDKRMLKKKRINDPILFITPLHSLICLADTRTFVFSLQGHGCEIVNIDTAKVIDLWRMGLSMQTSKMLLIELKSVLNTKQEKSNG